MIFSNLHKPPRPAVLPHFAYRTLSGVSTLCLWKGDPPGGGDGSAGPMTQTPCRPAPPHAEGARPQLGEGGVRVMTEWREPSSCRVPPGLSLVHPCKTRGGRRGALVRYHEMSSDASVLSSATATDPRSGAYCAVTIRPAPRTRPDGSRPQPPTARGPHGGLCGPGAYTQARAASPARCAGAGGGHQPGGPQERATKAPVEAVTQPDPIPPSFPDAQPTPAAPASAVSTETIKADERRAAETLHSQASATHSPGARPHKTQPSA